MYFFTGVLVPELVTCLVLLQLHTPTVIQGSNCTALLHSLLDVIDKFNQMAPGCHRDNNEDLAWPGVWGWYFTQLIWPLHSLL